MDPVLVLEVKHCCVHRRFNVRWVSFVHPHTMNCWTAKCTTTTRISSSLDCNSFKVLPFMTGGNCGSNSDRQCLSCPFLLIWMMPKCWPFVTIFLLLACGIQENTCKQKHGIHFIWGCLTRGQWASRLLTMMMCLPMMMFLGDCSAPSKATTCKSTCGKSV